MTDTSISAPVRTIAGQQDVAIQLLDESPLASHQGHELIAAGLLILAGPFDGDRLAGGLRLGLTEVSSVPPDLDR